MRIILKLISGSSEVVCEDVDWINLDSVVSNGELL